MTYVQRILAKKSRSKSRWTPEEDEAIRLQAKHGRLILQDAIPGRTINAIMQRAHVLGVTVKRVRLPSGESRWRGRLPIPEHAHPLVRRFISELNREETLISEVAERSGICRDTISGWRYRRSPLVTNFVAALNVLGLDLAIVRKREMEAANGR